MNKEYIDKFLKKHSLIVKTVYYWNSKDYAHFPGQLDIIQLIEDHNFYGTNQNNILSEGLTVEDAIKKFKHHKNIIDELDI